MPYLIFPHTITVSSVDFQFYCIILVESNLILISYAYRLHSNGVVMAVLWLLIVVMGLTTEEAFCSPQKEFGNPPPLPEEGILCISMT